MNEDDFFYECTELQHHHNFGNTNQYNNHHHLLSYYDNYYLNGTSNPMRGLKINSNNENQNIHEFDTFSSYTCTNPIKFSQNNQTSSRFFYYNTSMIHTDDELQTSHKFQISHQETCKNLRRMEQDLNAGKNCLIMLSRLQTFEGFL